MTWRTFPTCKWGQYILALSLALLLGEVEGLQHTLKMKELLLQPLCSPADAIPSLRKHSAGGYRKYSTSPYCNIFVLNGVYDL